MGLLCIGGVVVGFIPQADGKEGKKHDTFAGISFLGYILGSILLVYPFIISKLYWVVPFTLLSIVFFAFLANSFFKG